MAEGKTSIIASILKTKCKDSKQRNCQNFIKKEDVLCVKRKILEIIESLSEGGVTAEKLLESCRMLTKNDYADVIDERNIQNLCGYPLCSNRLQVLKQQFRIVLKVNRVYDITEMKGFCSSTCYKASCYLKEQLSEIAVWFREDPVTLSLLSDADNRGSMGEVVPLHEENLHETDGEAKCENEGWFTKEDKKLLHEELSKCTDYFKNLEVTEKGVQTTTTTDDGKKQFHNSLPKKVTFSEVYDNEKTKNFEICSESDAESDCTDDNEYFPVEENKNTSEKLMPIVRPNKVKAILINPDTKSVIDTPPQVSNPISLCAVKGILKNWITPDTVEFLSGKLPDDSSPAISTVDLLSDKEQMCQANKKNDVHRVLSEIKEITPEIPNATNNETLPSEDTDLTKTINVQIEMVNRYFQGENLQGKKKQSSTVKFKTGHNGGVKLIKNEAPKLAVDPASPLDAKGQYDSESNLIAASELMKLPKVDSTSQNALRRQVVCVQLKNAFSDILPLIGLHYNVLGDTVLRLVSTFRLTASNVVHKPNEWKLLAVVLFRLVMKSRSIKNEISEGFAEEETFSLMLKKTSVCEHLSVHEIDEAIKGLFYCNTQSEKCI